LAQTHRGEKMPHEQKIIEQQLLTPEEELELAANIDGLAEQKLSPTREMVQSFASTIAKTEVSDSWVRRLLYRPDNALTSRWTSAVTSDRHAADSYDKYSKCFDMLNLKIREKGIEAEHMYNMDEKGFMIGHIGRSKRIFSKAKRKTKQFEQALGNDNCE
jgi:hypothetical protein